MSSVIIEMWEVLEIPLVIIGLIHVITLYSCLINRYKGKGCHSESESNHIIANSVTVIIICITLILVF